MHKRNHFFSRLLVIVAISGLAGLVVGCGSEAPSTLRLFVFDCGRLQFDSVAGFGLSDDDTDVRDLVVSCYLIEHPDGRVLFDGGLPPSMLEPDGWTEMDGGWRMRQDKPLFSQLEEIGLTLSDIDYAVFSHFHFDHIGIANDLQETRLFIQRAEFDQAFADSLVPGYFDPTVYDRFPRENIEVIEGDHDIFGDGRVQILSTPGHTLGHQSLLVKLENTGPVILSGDLHIMAVGRSKRAVAPFNLDSTLTVASMNRVEELLQDNGGELWIGHDLATYERLKHPPLFMD